MSECQGKPRRLQHPHSVQVVADANPGAREHLVDQSGITHGSDNGSRAQPGVREAAGKVGPAPCLADRLGGRFEPHQSTETGRDPDGTQNVGPEPCGAASAGYQGGFSSGRSAAGSRRIQRISRRSVAGIVRLPGHGELRNVAAGNDDSALFPQSPDSLGVFFEPDFRHAERAGSNAMSGQAKGFLDRYGQAGEASRPRVPRLGQRLFAENVGGRVEHVVPGFQPGKVRANHVLGGDLAAFHGDQQVDRIRRPAAKNFSHGAAGQRGAAGQSG